MTARIDKKIDYFFTLNCAFEAPNVRWSTESTSACSRRHLLDHTIVVHHLLGAPLTPVDEDRGLTRIERLRGSTAVISPSGPFATRRYILPNCWTRTDDAQILRRRRRAPPRGSLLSLRARGRLLETRWPRAPHSGAARPPPSRGGSFVPRAPVTLSATSKSRKVKSVSRQLSPQPSKGPFAAEKLDAINFV